MAPRLSVIVPAYDEASRIGQTLERIHAYLNRIDGGSELIVVDDGSRDTTVPIVTAAAIPGLRLVRLEENQGKGAALRAGVAASAGEEVLLCDADLSTPIEEYEALRPHLVENDLVLGSRSVDGARISRHQPRHREAMGKIFNRLVRLLVIDGFRDTQCGFKLLRGGVARDLFARMRIDRFAYDVELIWLAVRRGHTVREVGVAWHDSPQSRVRPLRDSTRMFLDLLRLRWRHRGDG